MQVNSNSMPEYDLGISSNIPGMQPGRTKMTNTSLYQQFLHKKTAHCWVVSCLG